MEFCAFFCVESLAFAWLGGLLFSSKSKPSFCYIGGETSVIRGLEFDTIGLWRPLREKQKTVSWRYKSGSRKDWCMVLAGLLKPSVSILKRSFVCSSEMNLTLATESRWKIFI